MYKGFSGFSFVMKRVYFISLGCDKNMVDSQQMTGLLVKEGFEITDDEMTADAVVINSCCFIGDAKEESINTIIEMGKLKEMGNLSVLLVCGCLAQRYSDEIRQELPEVDVIVGTSDIDKVARALHDAFEGKITDYIEDPSRNAYMGEHRLIMPGSVSAALKIAEGCDKRCTYCIIPKVRGRFRSYPMDELVKEAEYLAGMGVRELMLVAQETTLYGRDLYGEKKLPELLKRLCAIEGIKWIRLLYAYPEEITDELIEVMAAGEKICHYIDMPIQSGSDSILKKMGRRCDSSHILSIVEKLRKRIPDICIRTTLISGFPGESDEEHEESISLVKKARFDRLGVFPYSPEEGTAAFEMEDQIPDEIRQARADELMEYQQQVVFEKNESLVGSVMEVMVEGRDAENGVYVCRSYRDAPDVDGYVFLEYEGEIISGDFVKVRITGAQDYDLIAVPEDR